jgi:hypothetical protein
MIVMFGCFLSGEVPPIAGSFEIGKRYYNLILFPRMRKLDAHDEKMGRGAAWQGIPQRYAGVSGEFSIKNGSFPV